MKDWQTALIPSNATFRKAIEIIDASALQAGLVVDDQKRLLGMLTDGTIRREILKGVSMQEDVKKVMFTNFTHASVNDDKGTILETMKKLEIRHIPVLDENGVLQDLKVLMDLLRSEKKENIVVLMAGGLGTRLMPLTEKFPKPLLKIGEKPILETILKSFKDQGFYRFYISVNYCAEMIKDYFQDGSRWDVEITYLQEDKPLGTAGALSLLPEKPDRPFFVMNGDLLTKIDFEKFLEFHVDHRAHGTMCVRQYDYQIPYGVVRFDGVDLLEMEEKPIKQFFVNAGIYVLSPESLDHVPADQFFDMPSLFKILKQKDGRAAVFPIHEYWMDIGQIKDFERANGEYPSYFNEREEK
jgi:dTDP-glucose pyrophosphorylase